MSAFNQFFVDYSAFFIIILILAIAALIYYILKIKKDCKILKEKQEIFFANTKVQDFESVVLEKFKNIQQNTQDVQDLYKVSEKIHHLAARGISNVGIVRFNPFEDTGSNQSFSIALLDSHKSGVVLSSLYTREGVRIYSKPIHKKESEFPLTEEEKEAINQSLNK